MDQDEEYIVPLTDQSVFGAGVMRKRVTFVPPEPATSPATANILSGATVADLYRSIVLQEGGALKSHEELNDLQISKKAVDPSIPNGFLGEALCEICDLPLQSPDPTQNPHEASLVHQVCLSHSHPPSHLDRSRKGLRYLSTYGWDLDSRLGLGPKGDGRLAPVRGKLKNDTLGVGFEEKLRKSKRPIVGVEKKVGKLDAKKVRTLEAEERSKRARLQAMFYGSDEVEWYLGSGG